MRLPDNEGFYSVRFGNGRVRKPREENRLADMDRLRILERLSRKEDWTMMALRNYVSEQNGLRPHDWDFYYVLRQMEEDALLIVKYDPERGETMVKITEYGQQQFTRTLDQISKLGS